MTTPPPHLYPLDPDSDSTPSPPSDPHDSSVRFMCSFGGKILPRPHDNQLRYVGGDTRIVSVPRRSTSFASLLLKLSQLAGKPPSGDLTIKYQLPNEDLDALITLASDEDLENMMEEHDRNPNSRLRLFLFWPDAVSRTSSSISSFLDGSTKRENWFLDALNGGSGSGPMLERGRSEVSSIVSEVPDYLFGLDNSDDQPKSKTRLNMVDSVSNSDPGSPAPVITSPFCSTSSSLAPPDLPPVKVKPSVSGPKLENPVENFMSQAPEQPVWHCVPDAHYPAPSVQHFPVYYVPGPVQPGNVPVHTVPMQAPYGQPFPPVLQGQIPVGYNQTGSGMGQVYGVGARPVTMVDSHNVPSRVITDNMNQPVFYRNPYTGMVVPGGDDVAGGIGPEAKYDLVNQPRQFGTF